MCRWFAYISETEECLLEDVLITPVIPPLAPLPSNPAPDIPANIHPPTQAHSLSKQVHSHYLPKLLSHSPDSLTTEHEITARNRLFNVDGLGLTWYTPARSTFSASTGPRPALYKCAQPPLHDSNFRSICAHTCTTLCFAHIRAATATATATTAVNNHPFVFGRHAFMHNGVVADCRLHRPPHVRPHGRRLLRQHPRHDRQRAFRRPLRDVPDRRRGADLPGSADRYPVARMKAALRRAVASVIALQKKNPGPPLPTVGSQPRRHGRRAAGDVPVLQPRDGAAAVAVLFDDGGRDAESEIPGRRGREGESGGV